jgi:hypothetical protein
MLSFQMTFGNTESDVIKEGTRSSLSHLILNGFKIKEITMRNAKYRNYLNVQNNS